MFNAFKREAPHLSPTLLRDGGKIVLLIDFETKVNKSGIEIDMIKLKLQQVEEIKYMMKREAQFYKIALALCLLLIVFMFLLSLGN